MKLKSSATALLLILVAIVGGVIATVTFSYNASAESQAEQSSLLTWRYLAVATAGSTNGIAVDLIRWNRALLEGDQATALNLQVVVARDIATTEELTSQLRGLNLPGAEAPVRDVDLRATQDFLVFVREFQGAGVHTNSDALTVVPGAVQTWQKSTGRVAPFIATEVRQNAADELARANLARQILLGSGALALTTVFLLAIVVFRSTLGPIVALAEAASALSRGADVEIPRSKRRDEIGDLGRALEAWKRTMQHRLAILDATVALNESHDIGELLNAGAATLLDLSSARQVAIAVMRDGKLVLAAAAPDRLGSEFVGMPATPQGPTSLAARTGRPVIGDLSDNAWYETWLQVPGLADCGPLLGLPLVSGGQVVGAAVCFRPAGDPAFTDADTEICQVVTTQLAAAVRQGNLFEELVAVRAALDVANRHTGALTIEMSDKLQESAEAIIGLTERALVEATKRPAEQATTAYLEETHLAAQELLLLVGHAVDVETPRVLATEAIA